jgi:hypothetical protein
MRQTLTLNNMKEGGKGQRERRERERETQKKELKGELVS